MKILALLSTLILMGFLATPSIGQDLDSFNLQILQRSVLKIKSFDSEGKLIREGAGFFLNAEGELITNRQVLRDAARVEIRTYDEGVYSAQRVTGVDDPTGVLRLATSNLQSKFPPLPISTAGVRDKQTLFILKDNGTVKLTEETDLSKTQIATLGQFYKVTVPMPLASSGSPVVNSSGEVVGILLVETIGGRQQTLIVPITRISSLKALADNSFAEWNKRNNLEWLFTGAGRYYKGIVVQVTEGCAQALSAFEYALEEDRTNANAWLLAGRCKAGMGDPQSAIEYYRRALRLNSGVVEAHLELSDAYIEAFGVPGAETYTTANELFRRALALRSTTNQELWARTQLYRNMSGFLPFELFASSDHGIRNYQLASKFGLRDPLVYVSESYEISDLSLKYDVRPINSTHTISGLVEKNLRMGADPWVVSNNLRTLDVDPWVNLSDLYPNKSYVVATHGLTHSWEDLTVYKPLAAGPQLVANTYKEEPPFNPFLKPTNFGAAYVPLGGGYPTFGGPQKAINLQPKVTFSFLYPDTAFLGANQNYQGASSVQRTFSLELGMNFGRNDVSAVDWGLNSNGGGKQGWSGAINFDFSGGTLGIKSREPIFDFEDARSSSFISAFSLPLTAIFSRPEQSSSTQNQEPPDTLFSATWFTQDIPSQTTTDLSAAVDYLRVGARYLLNVALKDTPFTPAKSPITIGQLSASASELIPGMEMEVTYFSKDLQPERGTSRIVTPQKGQTLAVAFPVSAITADLRGIDVWVEIRLKGLIVYSGTLKISVVPQTAGIASEAESSRKGGALHLAANPSFKASAARKYEPLRDHDVEIIITPQATGPFNISIDWKGKERKSGPSGLTLTRLNELLTGVRGDLENRLAAASALGGIKKEGSEEREIDSLTMDPNIRQQLIFQLAKLGNRLYDRLFQDQELRILLAKIRAHAQKQPETVLRVQIKHAIRGEFSQRLLLPFGLLYDGPKLQEDGLYDAKAEDFWDSRYQIELDETNSAYQKETLCDSGPVRVIAVMDTGGTEEGNLTAEEWRKEVREQQKYLKELMDTQRISLKFAKNEEEFLNIFRGDPAPLDLIYYYGHTSTTPKPSFSITSASRDLIDIEDAARGTDNRLRALKDHPFVFLNSCRGVAFAGDSEDTFLNLMNKLGASGFIGTETTVRIPYAARIGQEFFRKLMSYKTSVPLVQVLSEMKHQALKSPDGNPLIMLYSIYGDPSLRTCSYK